MVAVGTFHGRAIKFPFDGDLGAVEGWLEGVNGVVETIGIGLIEDTDIHFSGAVGGDDIAAHTTIDHTDIDGNTVIGLIKGEQFLGDVTHFEDGADPFVGVEAGVGGLAVGFDNEVTDPFAGGFEVAEGAEGGFGDEGAVHVGGEAHDMGTGFGTANFFVAVDEEARGDGQVDIEGVERFEGVNNLNEAGFHVVDTRTAHDIVFSGEGHGGEGADGPDGVGVAEEHLFGLVAGGKAWFGEEMATCFLAGNEPRAVAELVEGVAQELLGAGLGAGVGGGGFGGDEPT